MDSEWFDDEGFGFLENKNVPGLRCVVMDCVRRLKSESSGITPEIPLSPCAFRFAKQTHRQRCSLYIYFFFFFNNHRTMYCRRVGQYCVVYYTGIRRKRQRKQDYGRLIRFSLISKKLMLLRLKGGICSTDRLDRKQKRTWYYPFFFLFYYTQKVCVSCNLHDKVLF